MIEKYQLFVDELCDLYKLKGSVSLSIGRLPYRIYGRYTYYPYSTRGEITLNKDFVRLNDEVAVFTTIYHEVMHHVNRICFGGKGHDDSFNRLMSLSHFEKRNIRLNAKWRITCRKCGNISHRKRLTQKTEKAYNNAYICGSCEANDFILEELK